MTEPQSKTENENNMNLTDDLKTVQLLAKGLLEVYEPPLVTLKTHLKELTEKQEAVHTMITTERHHLEDLQNDAMLDALLADIATNKEKLNSISNSMTAMHKRVQSLQVRAANVEKVAKSRANQQKPTMS
ncbi:biogenesis of lysosome-related organelles complex 1 subunit 6-like [Aricia agestis]|uniref:biogenesis of lysosome-related organelles complex 1 subunit 6-like n=1 Tax=Aricia agestis TaxID=91739 RepID=UPI001C2076DE|nr:biogenesis of lysosome-related organelles complex 1 subunit 6-like [Aricia agestis]XP_041968053.1 biogenesis of lysosome-related organelles complex 1 subunit 6-like [Aricia agestis]